MKQESKGSLGKLGVHRERSGERVKGGCHGGQPLVGFPSVLAFNPNDHRLVIRYGSRWTQTLDQASQPCRVSRGDQLEYG